MIGPRNGGEQLPTNKGFICLNRALKQWIVCFHCSPEPMQHEPRGFLRDPKFTIQLHRGYTLEIRSEQVNSNGPCAIGQPGVLKDRAHPNRELPLVEAIPATVRHAMMLDT